MIESLEELLAATYGIKLFDQPAYFLCHAAGTGDVVVDKPSANCGFHMISPELDMNSMQASCAEYCQPVS